MEQNIIPLDEGEHDGVKLFYSHRSEPPSESDKDSTFVEPSSPLKARIESLLRLIQIVSNPHWAVSFEEICEILLDLGLLIKEQSLKTQLNPDIYEHPGNFGDALGNVLMVHKQQKLPQLAIFETVGSSILDLVHKAFEKYRHDIGKNYDWNELSNHFASYPLDDTNSEDIVPAKKLIRSLRLDNNKLEYKNDRLYKRMQKLKHRLEDECGYKFAKKSSDIPPASPSKKPPTRTSKHLNRKHIDLVCENGVKQILQRTKLQAAKHADSQCEFDFGEEK